MPAQQIAATINFSMAHPKEPVKPQDFMPSEWAKQAQLPKPKRRSKQKIADDLRTMMKQLMAAQNG